MVALSNKQKWAIGLSSVAVIAIFAVLAARSGKFGSKVQTQTAKLEGKIASIGQKTVSSAQTDKTGAKVDTLKTPQAINILPHLFSNSSLISPIHSNEELFIADPKKCNDCLEHREKFGNTARRF